MRVLDAKGQELCAGDQVERYFVAHVYPPTETTGGEIGEILALTKRDVLVQFGPWTPVFFHPSRDSLLRRTYRCNDLIRTDERRG